MDGMDGMMNSKLLGEPANAMHMCHYVLLLLFPGFCVVRTTAQLNFIYVFISKEPHSSINQRKGELKREKKEEEKTLDVCVSIFLVFERVESLSLLF